MITDLRHYQLNDGKTVEQKLDEIWNSINRDAFSDIELEILDRGYAIENCIEEDTILFVGINPSYDEITSADDENKHLFYDKFDNSFFSVAKKMTKEVFPDKEFSHHDIYFVRDKNQRNIMSMYHPESHRTDTFFIAQKELSNAIVLAAHPRLIVLANAHVSDLFVEQCKDFYHFDESVGTYIINPDRPLAGTPVFCSGMLSQGRALDRHSRNRLMWQIESFLKRNGKIL